MNMESAPHRFRRLWLAAAALAACAWTPVVPDANRIVRVEQGDGSDDTVTVEMRDLGDGRFETIVRIGEPMDRSAAVRRAAPRRAVAGTTVWYVDANATGANDGSSWCNAFTDLSQALQNAAANNVGTMKVAKGSYAPSTIGLSDPRTATFVPFWATSGCEMIGGFAGCGAPDPDAYDPETNVTTLSGDLGIQGDDSDNAYSVVKDVNGVLSGLFKGFMVTGGNANGPLQSGTDIGGGAFFSGSPIVQRCRFVSNKARRNGGGAYFTHGVGQTEFSPQVDQCRFDLNQAGSGAGVYCVARRAKFNGGRFEANQALGYTDQSGFHVLGWGAAVLLNPGNISGGANVTEFANLTFARNDAEDGGAIHSGGSPSLDNVRFNTNRARRVGGGLFNFGFQQLVPTSGQVTMTNATVADNVATLQAGGLFLSEGTLDLKNSNIWANTAMQTMGVEDPQIGLFAMAATANWSNVEGGWKGAGTNNFDVNPRMTPDGHLSADSPLINAGDPGFVPSPSGASEGDADPRIHGGRVDIGADEFRDTDADGLPDYWEAAYAAAASVVSATADLGPNDDLDLDGMTNREEYEQFGSKPVGATQWVDCTTGDDTYDGSSPTYLGGLAGPKKNIQTALDAAGDGDTVMVMPGTCFGALNRNLDFQGKGKVLRSVTGSAGTIIDAEGQGRCFNFATQETNASAVVGFTMQNGMADFGGGIQILNAARPQVNDSILRNNAATTSGGALYIERAGGRFARMSIDPGTAVSTAEAGDVINSHVQVDGPVTVMKGKLRLDESWVDGAEGQVNLDQAAIMEARTKVTARTSLMGAGELSLPDENSSLEVDGSASASPVGVAVDRVRNFGRVTIRAAGLAGGDVDTERMRFEKNATKPSTFRDALVVLSESSSEFGGELAVDAETSIENNAFLSIGDRYFNLDPDPEAAVRPTLTGNTFSVTIPSLPVIVASPAGIAPLPKLMELRSPDVDCVGSCQSGAYQVAASPGYMDTWAMEELEIQARAKVSLTNRPKFNFQGDPTAREALYVTNLVLGDDAVLNVGAEALYYKTLTMGTGALIKKAALHGLSLNRLSLISDEEFAVRVVKRLTDMVDFVPSIGPLPASPLPEGEIARLGDVLTMKTRRSSLLPSASSVEAKVEFDRAAEEQVSVRFNYRWVQNASAELIVRMSDSRDIGINDVEVARVRAPLAGRPGSIGSPEYATFLGKFPRGALNMTRAVYLSLELRGKISEVYIKDLEAVIRCAYRGEDISGDNLLSNADYNYALNSYGAELPDLYRPRWCIDTLRSEDGRIDVNDMLSWDSLIDQAATAARPDGPPEDVVPTDSGRTFSPNRWIMGGKSTQAADQEDYLYSLNISGLELDAAGNTLIHAGALDDLPQRPASLPGTKGYRSNGRFTVDRLGRGYQIHGAQGLVDVTAGVAVVPSGERVFGGLNVKIGAMVTAATTASSAAVTGEPLLDAAFSRTEDQVVYVVPVLVTAAAGHTYKTAAKLRLTAGGPNPYEVEQLYGVDPATDAMINVDPPEASDIDVQQVRELEIDTAGKLWVLSTKASGHNKWLLTYDEAVGTASEQRINLRDVAAQLRSPTSLLVSQDGAAVYLADGFDPTAPANRQLFRFGYTTTANSTAGLVLEQVVEVSGMQHVTGVTENPGDGALFVTGFNAAAYDEYATFNEGDAIAATASLAVVCPGFDLITAAELTGYPLALPLGTTTTCRREACTTICRPLLNGPQPETNPTAKNRYLSFVPSNPGQETALRIVPTLLHEPPAPAPAGTPDWSPVEGFARYVNAIRDENDLPVFDCPDSAVRHTSFKCAQLGCQPEYRDWAAITGGEALHVTGRVIVPSSTYEVSHLASSCTGNEATCTTVSGTLAVPTARFGDVDPVSGGLNVLDVAALVDKVKDLASGTMLKPRAQLQPVLPNPLANTNVLDIATGVDALKGRRYPYTPDSGDCCPGESIPGLCP
ncbi:MAG: hypothetical protein AABZ12_11260 [Planctomycetota bacterium]